jgi:S1-C subfamily serine protease
VAGVLPGSAARRAGRVRVGDLIEQFNGHSVRTPADLVGAIRAARALQTVKIQLVRHGRRMTVIQPLGAPPAR